MIVILLLRKVSGFALTAAVTVFLLYPVLHECGHILAAWATGCSVTGIAAFPYPSVSLSTDGAPQAQTVFIAVCGGWFPLLLLLLPGSENLYVYCVKGTVALTSVFCGLESAARGIVLLCGGPACACNDAVMLLLRYPGSGDVVFLSLFVQIAVGVGYLSATSPLGRIVRYWLPAA